MGTRKKRKNNNPNLKMLWNEICRHPGLKPRQYETILGLGRGSTESLLSSLELNDFLLFEDDYGRLFPWKGPGYDDGEKIGT